MIKYYVFLMRNVFDRMMFKKVYVKCVFNEMVLYKKFVKEVMEYFCFFLYGMMEVVLEEVFNCLFEYFV